MTCTLTVHKALAYIGHFFEHAAFVVIGLAMMIVGLALGVTMVMLPVGLAIGLIGMAMVIGGLFARIDSKG